MKMSCMPMKSVLGVLQEWGWCLDQPARTIAGSKASRLRRLHVDHGRLTYVRSARTSRAFSSGCSPAAGTAAGVMLSAAATTTTVAPLTAVSCGPTHTGLRLQGNANDQIRKLSRHIHDDIARSVNGIPAWTTDTTLTTFPPLTACAAGVTSTTARHSITAVATLATFTTCSAWTACATGAGHRGDQNLRHTRSELYAFRDVDGGRHARQTITTGIAGATDGPDGASGSISTRRPSDTCRRAVAGISVLSLTWRIRRGARSSCFTRNSENVEVTVIAAGISVADDRV